MRLGQALGGTTRQVVEQITLLYGLGVVAVFLAAVALGRLAVVGVKDARLAEEAAAATEGDTALDPFPGPRPPLARRRAGTERGNVPPPRGPWPEEVPATPSDPMTPRGTNPSDVKVAGKSGAEETRTTDRPGANA